MNRMQPARTAVTAAVSAVAALAWVAPAQALTTTWLGGNGSWFTPGGWSAGVPAAADTAAVGTGTVALASDASAAALALSGGTIAGAGSLTLTGASTWTGGVLNGTGTTHFGGDLSITGNTAKGVNGGRIVVLAGTTTWAGNTGPNGNAIVFNAGTVRQQGVFDDRNAFDTLFDTQSTTLFDNSGTYNKLGNAVTSMELPFDNSGSVAVAAGRLALRGGTGTGSYSIAAGSSLAFVFGSYTLQGATVGGAGTFEVAGGTVLVAGGTHAAPLLLSSGNLGGSAHTFGAAATWTGGNIGGAGTTTFAGPLAIVGNTAKGINGTRTVVLDGATTWSGNSFAGGNSVFFNQGTIDNRAVFTDANDFASAMDTLGTTLFRNAGTYRKTGAGTTSLEVAFDNPGSVEVAAGRLALRGGTATGRHDIAAGATLAYVFGTYTANDAVFAGAGTVEVAGGNVVFNGGTHAAPLLLSSGSIHGTTATFTAPATWTGGSMSGAGTTRFENTLAIAGNNGKSINGGRVVELAGTTTWSGNTGAGGNALVFNNGTIANSGRFVDANAHSTLIDTQSVTAFVNTGRYDKTGASTTTIEIVFDNTGTVDVQAGRLDVASTFDNRGTVGTAAGAIFGATNLSRDLVNHGLLQGYGSFDPASGRTLLNAGRVAPGAPAGVGALAVAGDYTQAIDGVLEIDLASPASFDVLAVSGAARLGGTIRVHDAGYVPAVGDTFVVLTYGQRLAGTTFAAVTTPDWGGGVSFEALYHAGDVTLRVAAVPEPATWALWAAGLAAAAAGTRRRGVRRAAA